MENFKKSYRNNKSKKSAPTWNEEFGLPDRSHSLSDIQEYFEYILRKHSSNFNDNNKRSIRIYIHKIEKTITFKVKTGYYLELLTPKY